MKIDWNIVSAVATLLTALAALAAILFQGLWMRRSMSLELNWRAEEQFFRNDSMLEKRRKAGAALLKNDMAPEVWKILDFFETLGLLVRQGVLDKDVVCCNYYNRLIAYWYSCEKYIQSERVRCKNPNLWCEVEKLVETLDTMQRKRSNGREVPPSPEAIYERLLEESSAS